MLGCQSWHGCSPIVPSLHGSGSTGKLSCCLSLPQAVSIFHEPWIGTVWRGMGGVAQRQAVHQADASSALACLVVDQDIAWTDSKSACSLLLHCLAALHCIATAYSYTYIYRAWEYRLRSGILNKSGPLLSQRNIVKILQEMTAGCQAPLSGFLRHYQRMTTYDVRCVRFLASIPTKSRVYRPTVHAGDTYPGIIYCLWWSSRIHRTLVTFVTLNSHQPQLYFPFSASQQTLAC